MKNPKIPKTPKTFVAKGLQQDADLIGQLLAINVDRVLLYGTPEHNQKHEIVAAWKRILSLAKAGVTAVEADARKILKEVTP